MNRHSDPRPVLHVSRWFNTPEPLALDELLGKVVAIHTFQMLCPGCVAHGLPQAVRLRESFPENQVAVIGLHTVFEHHAVMGADALQAFISEYRLPFPVGVDAPDPEGPVPLTMAAWGLRGTPSLVLLGREGRVEFSHFGRLADITLGSMVGQLLGRPGIPAGESNATAREEQCDAGACVAPERPFPSGG